MYQFDMDKRLAIYLRVSTNGQSTELQRKEIEAYLTARDLHTWTIYEDKFTGTSSSGRPALQRLLSDARLRKIDVIICWKLDRLFRSLKDLVTTMQELQDLGVDLISLKDQIDMTSASGRLLVHLLAAFAEFEASLIKERVMSGLANAKQKGVILGRPRTIDHASVAKLRAKGLSLNQIARELGITKSGVSKTLKKLNLQTTENIESKEACGVVDKTKVYSTDEEKD